ncbi:hypothetical protein V6N12_035176 [Hibiscus sabdariffa]|uniref:Carbohydrate kinase PfkB domain-containing protein n=1 Tax=Hibiscus sabdariffa TaxID=183260 RepID=A0ABR2ALA4_9ROSI
MISSPPQFPDAISVNLVSSLLSLLVKENFQLQGPNVIRVASASSPTPHRSLFHTIQQLGLGAVSVDFLATVASFPNPDDKIRSTSLKVQGGGNSGNALTCAARLGLNPRLISKVANDSQGKGILEELEADGVNTFFFIVSEEGNSPFTYVIVDNQTKTRTCINTPGYPPLIPEELSHSSLLSALDGANMVYFDGRHPETALLVAKEAARKNMPILVEAERKREGLDDLLEFANYAVCSAKFPQAWTEAPSVPSALISMLLRLPKLKFVIVTMGEDGCIMLERSVNGGSDAEEIDVHSILESLKQRKDDNKTIPTCISSVATRLTSNGIGTLTGRLFLGTAEKIPPSELVDTTGAGDAFIGAVLYVFLFLALCAGMPQEKMLPFAARVAATGCRALGARAGLPLRTDPRLAGFL